MAQNISWYGMIAPEESQFRVVNVKPVTLYDVAEYAGVSYQTVSRVVNQASHVSAKTREKVEAAMAQLNYIPNRVAQQLAGKQSLLIGVATSSLALHAPSQIVAAIKSRADQLGASVMVSMVERSSVEACKAAVHNLLAQRVSGLIINYPLDDEDAIAVEAACANVPALFLDVSDQTPINSIIFSGTVAKLAMRQPFVLFKGLTFQKLCLPGAFRPGDHHNKMLRPGLCVVHASPQYL